MKVTHDLSVITDIPFQRISHFHFSWGMDAHAALSISGIIAANAADEVFFKNYKDSAITVKYEADTIFCGLVKCTRLTTEARLYQMEVKAASASAKLDIELHNEMFQDCSITYKQMIRSMVSKKSGNVICTIGEKMIENPQLCYQETLWQYSKRMASQLHGHIISDIMTGKPAFWFGLRAGKNIENHELNCTQIEIKKQTRTVAVSRTSYLMKGRQNYQLGDCIFIDNNWQVIYEKEAYLERGEVIFSYLAAHKKSLYQRSYSHSDLTGLSLQGTVEKTEREQVYVRLDIDDKTGVYPFPWYPETGNGLYAMPEKGSKAELYFVEADETTAIAVRCRDTYKCNSGEKRLELPKGAKIAMDAKMISLNKTDKVILSYDKVSICGKNGTEITARGRIKISGKIVEIGSEDAVNCSTEW